MPCRAVHARTAYCPSGGGFVARAAPHVSDGDERTAIDGFRSLRMLWSAYTRVHFNARVLDAQECGIWNLFFDSRDQSPVVKIGCKGC